MSQVAELVSSLLVAEPRLEYSYIGLLLFLLTSVAGF
jgi:hypothetical protein